MKGLIKSMIIHILKSNWIIVLYKHRKKHFRKYVNMYHPCSTLQFMSKSQNIPHPWPAAYVGTIASQITSLTIVYSTVYSDADQRKHQSSASLAFVRGIHRGPVNSPHKWPVTGKMLPFDDVIMTDFAWRIVMTCIKRAGIVRVSVFARSQTIHQPT